MVSPRLGATSVLRHPSNRLESFPTKATTTAFRSPSSVLHLATAPSTVLQQPTTAQTEPGSCRRGRSSRMAGAGGERWVGLATDFSEGSRAALRWAADNLLHAGDQLLLLHVIKEADYEQSEAILWESTGSPLIPLSEFSNPITAKKYGAKPDAETLDLLNTVAREKEVMVVVKVLWGDPREKLCQAINEMPLSCLVIGSRGLGKLKRVLLGSVSDYIVNNATCPVTVVKPKDG
ncbi:hypothetical protein PAHAL_3G128100 [Panicum hallii]|uniref:UspA domain-containing protein n=1 Tax=Panicum hallii TaxID=206008 RepID=A0A2T8KI05_9POAL|nr:hypothetical protein PAHAL_3G128100 [Panicum hallii]